MSRAEGSGLANGAEGNGLRAKKRFGQHFLAPEWVEKVIRAIDPKAHQAFIEIGPGAGALTRPLAARAKSVTAFEIDRELVADLRRSAIPDLNLIEGDFLETPSSQFSILSAQFDAIRVAGNLPYNVASPIMFRLVDLYRCGVPLTDATLMLQREVADRLLAPPGGKEYGVLSVLMRHAADAEMLLKLPPGAFRPPPRVQSALVRLRFRASNPPVADQAVFTALVRAVFTRRRKTLANALLAYEGAQRVPPAQALNTADIDGRRRPETLSIPEFGRLADAYAAVGAGSE
jgi:16S rRNA (adenine1518-N6/adenine1519-N6)-dimethyltransferase